MKTDDYQGDCICVHCGTKVAHIHGKPCREGNCPNCGKVMMRENSYHHQLYLKNKGEVNHVENSNPDKGQCCG